MSSPSFWLNGIHIYMHVHGKGLVVKCEWRGNRKVMIIHGHGAKLKSLGVISLRGVGLAV